MLHCLCRRSIQSCCDLGRDAEIIARPTDSSKRRQLPGVAVSAGRLGMNHHARLTIHKLSHCHDGRSAGAARGPDMSGIVSGINYNLLFSGETSTDATTAILSALESNTSSSTPTTTFVSSGNPITDLKLAQQEQTTGVARKRNSRRSPTRSPHSRRRYPAPPASSKPCSTLTCSGAADRQRPVQLQR